MLHNRFLLIRYQIFRYKLFYNNKLRIIHFTVCAIKIDSKMYSENGHNYGNNIQMDNIDRT